MPADVLANNAGSTLNAAVTTTPAAGTSELWTFVSTASFPQIGTGGTQQFRLTVGPDSDTNPEIVICTQVNSATTATVTRGAEGSPIKTHAVGDPVVNTITSVGIQAMRKRVISVPFAATITPDPTITDILVITPSISANMILANPVAGAIDGDSFKVRYLYDATGGWTITHGTNYKFGDVTNGSWPTTPNSRFTLAYEWDAGWGHWKVVALGGPYA